MGYDKGWFLEEQKEKIFNFAHAIDLIVMDGNIITDDIRLLERSFDFQKFIHEKAKKAADRIAGSGLFTGMDILNAYLDSDARSHRPYRKKLMKALDSPVLEMTAEELYAKVSTLPRWKNKFRELADGKISVTTNKQIESMIDLVIERFTVSEVSGQEYDTEVKKKAEKESPAGTENQPAGQA